MLEKNQIGQNPRRNRRTSTPAMDPAAAATSAPSAPAATGWAFASADDYDATGILAGVDLSASLYWWMPELYTSPVTTSPVTTAAAPRVDSRAAVAAAADPHPPVAGSPATDADERVSRAGQAARRPGSRSPAAA